MSNDDTKSQDSTDELVRSCSLAATYIRAVQNERRQLVTLLKAVITTYPADRHQELARIHSWINRLEHEPNEFF